MIARESGENAVGQRRLRSHARRGCAPDVVSERHDVFGTLAQRRHHLYIVSPSSASYYGNRQRASSRLPIESVAPLGFMCEEVRYRSVGILDKLVGAQQTRSKHRL